MKWVTGFLGAILVCTLYCAGAAYAWGNAGHQIVAYIAADNLNPDARRSVARLLGTPDQMDVVSEAMAMVSILPDTEFRNRDPSTASWHFINLCLQDHRNEIDARCRGNCIV